MGKKPSFSAESYLQAESIMWLATGDTLLDEDNPASVLARLIERKIPSEHYHEWLREPLPDGKTPQEHLAGDDLDSLLEALEDLPDVESPVTMTSNGR